MSERTEDPRVRCLPLFLARDGGIAGAVADAGLELERLARPVPGLFAIYRVRRPAPA